MYHSSISRTSKVLKQLFDHYNSIGLTEALEAYTVRVALENYNDDLYYQIAQALQDEGLTRKEIEQGHNLVRKARDRLLPIAATLHVPQTLSNIIAKMKRLELQLQALRAISSSKVVPQANQANWLDCLSAAFLLGVVAKNIAIVCAGCSIPNPNAPIACLLCGYGLVAYLTAWDAYLDGCVM